MNLRPGPGRARRLRTPPDPLQAANPDRAAEAGGTGRGDPPPTVRHHPAAGAAGPIDVGLDRHHQPLLVVDHVEHVHPSGVEHRISPAAPTHTRTTPIVIHVGVFFDRSAWSQSILKTPTHQPRLRHAQQLTHAQIRRAPLWPTGYFPLSDSQAARIPSASLRRGGGREWAKVRPLHRLGFPCPVGDAEHRVIDESWLTSARLQSVLEEVDEFHALV
jgi:hypothetical protein